jgi:hypothetical protein
MAPPDMGAPPEDMGMDAEAPVEEEDPGEVVATILKKADGSFVLEGAAAPMEAGAPPEMGMEGMAPGGEPQTFTPDETGIGDLLTAIHNIIDPENPEGPAAQANFEEGFGGEEEEAPAEPIKAM